MLQARLNMTKPEYESSSRSFFSIGSDDLRVDWSTLVQAKTSTVTHHLIKLSGSPRGSEACRFTSFFFSFFLIINIYLYCCLFLYHFICLSPEMCCPLSFKALCVLYK